MKYILLCLLSAIALLSLSTDTYAYPGGISGRTLKGPSPGCTCHTPNPNPNVKLTISGPHNVIGGQTANFQVLVTYTSTIAGAGIDIAASTGTLAATDTLLRVLNGELTHNAPQDAIGDSLLWNFRYTAPSTPGTDTLYATGTGEFISWNNAQPPFVVTISPATAINDNGKTPFTYNLEQNYPNPFNPSTEIKFSLKETGFVTLRIYNLLGQQVAELVNGVTSQGDHSIQFDARGLNSGIYFYTLKAGNDVSLTRKMILLK